MINELLRGRALPELLSDGNGGIIDNIAAFEEKKEAIKRMLCEKQYGTIPNRPDHMSVTVLEENKRFCAGKAVKQSLSLSFDMNGEKFSFPADAVIPKNKKNIPAFIHINFRPNIPDEYQPSEEIVDRGFAVFTVCYKSVTSDDGDFKSGIAQNLLKSRRRKDASGKIAMWAWAAMRLLDYALSLDVIDKENVAVIGHSRLGKTALLAGAFDERFKYVISNDSGCSGAAISRGKKGERKADICRVFPHWFCPAYLEAEDDESLLPFDQHFLLALSAPRHLLVGSAEEDIWADPESEFLSLAATKPVYALYGKAGLVDNGTIPEATAVFSEGDCHYHVRHGAHYLSREDWSYYMNFIERKINAT